MLVRHLSPSVHLSSAIVLPSAIRRRCRASSVQQVPKITKRAIVRMRMSETRGSKHEKKKKIEKFYLSPFRGFRPTASDANILLQLVVCSFELNEEEEKKDVSHEGTEISQEDRFFFVHKHHLFFLRPFFRRFLGKARFRSVSEMGEITDVGPILSMTGG